MPAVETGWKCRSCGTVEPFRCQECGEATAFQVGPDWALCGKCGTEIEAPRECSACGGTEFSLLGPPAPPARAGKPAPARPRAKSPVPGPIAPVPIRPSPPVPVAPPPVGSPPGHSGPLHLPGAKLAQAGAGVAVGILGLILIVRLASAVLGWFERAPATTAATGSKPLRPAVVLVVPERLNLRGQATTRSPILETAARGTKLKVLDEQGEWYKVEAPGGGEAWVAKSFVSPPGPDSRPAVAAAPAGTHSWPEVPYQDLDACPFEKCAYGEWLALREVVAREDHDGGRAVAFTILKGDRVQAESGVVITTQLGRARVRKLTEIGNQEANAGSEVSVLHYSGAGLWSVWHNGATDEAGIDVPREHPAPDAPLELLDPPVTAWWIRVRSAAGHVGWVQGAEGFSTEAQSPASPAQVVAAQEASSAPTATPAAATSEEQLPAASSPSGEPIAAPLPSSAKRPEEGGASRQREAEEPNQTAGQPSQPSSETETAPPPADVHESSQTSELANGLTGTWKGIATQSSRGRRVLSYPVVLTVAGDELGSLATSEYSTLGCAGILRLLSKSARTGVYLFREHLTAGRWRCVDGGLVRARKDGAALNWEWLRPDGEREASAILSVARD